MHASPPKTNLACQINEKLSGHLPTNFDKKEPARSSGESFATKFNLNMKARAGRIDAHKRGNAAGGRLSKSWRPASTYVRITKLHRIAGWPAKKVRAMSGSAVNF